MWFNKKCVFEVTIATNGYFINSKNTHAMAAKSFLLQKERELINQKNKIKLVPICIVLASEGQIGGRQKNSDQ